MSPMRFMMAVRVNKARRVPISYMVTSMAMRKIMSDALNEYSYHRAGLICFLRFLTYHL